jgi:hypothetical protein
MNLLRWAQEKELVSISGHKQDNVKVILRPTVSPPVRLGIRNPSGTSDQFFPFSLTIFLVVPGLLMWGALSDEKSGLYFSVFGGHRQRSLPHFQLCFGLSH